MIVKENGGRGERETRRISAMKLFLIYTVSWIQIMVPKGNVTVLSCFPNDMILFFIIS